MFFLQWFRWLDENGRHRRVSVGLKQITFQKIGFQKGHSTEHVIAQLPDRIHESFEKDNCTLGVFIDLSKAFDACNSIQKA